MVTPVTNPSSTANREPGVLDAVIIGAGFSGMYQLHLLRDRLGLSDGGVVIALRPRTQLEVQPAPEPQPEPTSSELPDELTRIPGLLGELTDLLPLLRHLHLHLSLLHQSLADSALILRVLDAVQV